MSTGLGRTPQLPVRVICHPPSKFKDTAISPTDFYPSISVVARRVETIAAMHLKATNSAERSVPEGQGVGRGTGAVGRLGRGREGQVNRCIGNGRHCGLMRRPCVRVRGRLALCGSHPAFRRRRGMRTHRVFRGWLETPALSVGAG